MIPQLIPAWFEDAACAGLEHVFFHADGERAPATVQRDEVAKRVCAGCPVSARCLEWAMENNEDYGVWGGRTVEERRVLARGMDLLPDDVPLRGSHLRHRVSRDSSQQRHYTSRAVTLARTMLADGSPDPAATTHYAALHDAIGGAA